MARITPERYLPRSMPPMTDTQEPVTTDPNTQELVFHLRLACTPGVGPRLRQRLLSAFGSLQGVFAANAADLARIERIGPRLAESILSIDSLRAAEKIVRTCHTSGVAILREGLASYPPMLSRIDDPPSVLFCRGELRPCDQMAVAIVGSRRATAYGIRAAEALAGGLARAGLTVVSGLARGIDAAAHRGAMAAGGRTLAVLGSGVLAVYPPEHEDLAEAIVAHGALVSENPPLASPTAGCFPQRNRIVSGLCLGTVVVQAAERSGALITARLAGEQGREVFAVPGPIDCRASIGCHRLIQDGAKLVGDVDDILAELGPLFETAVTSCSPPRAQSVVAHGDAERSDGRPANLGEPERTVFAHVGEGANPIDRIVETTGLEAASVLSAIAMLELRRLVRRVPGNAVERR